MGLKERTEAYLHSKGVNPADIPKALATFTAAKYVIWVSSIAFGMRYRPLKILFNRPLPRRMWTNFQTRYPEFYERNHQRMMVAAEKLANTRIFAAIADRISTQTAQNRSQAAIGLAEGMLLYKIFLPIHLPLTFWAVTKYYMGSPKFDPTKPFEGLAEDYRSESIYENRIMNAYQDDLTRLLEYTKQKYIPEYILNFPKSLGGDAGSR